MMKMSEFTKQINILNDVTIQKLKENIAFAMVMDNYDIEIEDYLDLKCEIENNNKLINGNRTAIGYLTKTQVLDVYLRDEGILNLSQITGLKDARHIMEYIATYLASARHRDIKER